MTTQLDRLEALAEEEAHLASGWLDADDSISQILAALPDLIRVARAAKEVADFWDKESPGYVPQVSRLSLALARLYREVES